MIMVAYYYYGSTKDSVHPDSSTTLEGGVWKSQKISLTQEELAFSQSLNQS